MNLDEIYKIAQDHKHGGSPNGMSKYETAAKCGRKANLQAKHRERIAKYEQDKIDESEDPDSRQIGTYYHLLHELGLGGQAANTVWDQTNEAYDKNFLEAVRLYRGYVEAWGSMLKRWGATLVGVEIPLGFSSDQPNLKEGLTGRADAIINIVDPATALENTGLDLEPGIYLFDFKTAKQKNAKQDWLFTFGNQSINYTNLYNQAHPNAPVKGFLFDLVIRHIKLRKEPQLDKNGKVHAGKSFYAFLAQVLPGDEEIVENLVQIGKRNMEGDIANPAHCFDGFNPCFAFAMGLCNRR